MRHFILPVAEAGYRTHQLAHVPTYLLDAPACKWEDPKVVQELLRHSSIRVTMDVLHASCDCGQAASSVESSANDRSEGSDRGLQPAAEGADFGILSCLTLHTGID